MTTHQTKSDLLDAIYKERAALEKQLAGLSAEQKSTPGINGEWAVKDVLTHLFTWEGMVRDWHATWQRGEKPQIPAPGIKWNETSLLNYRIFEQHRHMPLEEVEKIFRESYQTTLTWVEGASEEELYTPGYYEWTGKMRLADYLGSATCSHYVWARKLIRQGLKNIT
jgi:hypothetical protein